MVLPNRKGSSKTDWWMHHIYSYDVLRVPSPSTSRPYNSAVLRDMSCCSRNGIFGVITCGDVVRLPSSARSIFKRTFLQRAEVRDGSQTAGGGSWKSARPQGLLVGIQSGGAVPGSASAQLWGYLWDVYVRVGRLRHAPRIPSESGQPYLTGITYSSVTVVFG